MCVCACVINVSLPAHNSAPTGASQMASCTLDASVKIYSCRVDSIHSEAYKVLGGFGRQEDPEAEAGPRDGADSDDEEADNKKAKRRVSDASCLLILVGRPRLPVYSRFC